MPGPESRPPGGGATLTAQEFAACVRDARGVLWTLAAGILGAADEAEDVLQEAALMALEKLEHYRRGTNFAAWMASFVRNVARNDLRKRVRRRTQAASAGGLDSMDALPGDRLGDRPEHALAGEGPLGRSPVNGRGELAALPEAFDDRLLSALGTLGTTQRACLLLRSVQELSYREIAQALDIPEGTAMSHVHRARLTLREVLAGTAETDSGPDRDGDRAGAIGPGLDSLKEIG